MTMAAPTWLQALPHIPYPPAKEHGYWPLTSTIDWCEENYYASHYVAELANTFTNSVFFLLSIKGIIDCIKYKHANIFLLAHVGSLITGIGSFAFHGSLTYSMQLVDELAMIYSMSIAAWAVHQHGRPQPFGFLFAVFMAGLALSITVYYHHSKNPIFHERAFAALAGLVFVPSIYFMEVKIRQMKSNRTAKAARTTKSGAAEAFDVDVWSRQLRTLITTGLGSFLTGFYIWHLDNVHCSQIRQWRHEIGLPLGLLLEGHAWWHVLTGYGTYLCTTWLIMLRHTLDGRTAEYYLYWPSWLSIPAVKTRPTAAGKKNK